jgi:hypothetical protein
MPPKFANYLFRNLKAQGASHSPEPAPADRAPSALDEQMLALRPEDFIPVGEDASPLDWSGVPEQTLQLPLGDTKGILDGRITVSAAVLRRTSPGIVQKEVADDAEYLVSLKTVVLQVQACLKVEHGEIAQTTGPDFDTPIAQVAREDEGFFKLEQATRKPAASPAARPQSAAESAFPLIREKPRPAQAEAPGLEISVPPLESEVKRPKFDPFADLPKVRPRSEQNPGGRGQETGEPPAAPRTLPGSPYAAPSTTGGQPDPDETPASSGRARIYSSRGGGAPPRESASAKAPGPSALALPPDKPLRRLGLEQLQEIFMTDDFLEARQVASLLAHFPKVRGVLILCDDAVMGGELPGGHDPAAALAAAPLLSAVREFSMRLNQSAPSGLTILSDPPVSVFQHGRVCILVAHQGRGLLPGMKERITDIAKALDAMYSDSGDSS